MIRAKASSFIDSSTVSVNFVNESRSASDRWLTLNRDRTSEVTHAQPN